MIYLDNAATTFPKPKEVYDYVDWVQRNIAVNIGRGSYKTAQDAFEIAEQARIALASLLHAIGPNAVKITSSATLAANEIIWGLKWDKLKNVYVSPFEHNAIMRPLEMVRNTYGFNVFELPFDGITHELDERKMRRLFSINVPDYVFVNQVSNVTGTIIPVENISKVTKEFGALIVVDGSQSVGLLDIDLRSAPIDYLIFAGHKNLYSSWGIGGFVSNSKYKLSPFLAGGTGSNSLDLNMTGFELGSPNIIAIASMSESIKWLNDVGIKKIAEHKKELVSRLIYGLRECGAELYLPQNLSEHTSVVSFNVPGYKPSEIGIILDQDFDIAVRTGFHCAPLVHKLIGTEERLGTIRASVGYFNTADDIQHLVNAISDIMGGI